MTYAAYTLGCKVNQYDTQALETMLRQRGYEPAASDADVVIINTCAVTAEAARKSRQAVRRLKSRHPRALLVVCGCYSQLEPEEVQALGADIVFGSGDKRALAEAIEKAFPARYIDDPFRRREFEKLPAGAAEGRTRAMLKIQDGCDNFCSYCVIPYTRGRVRSLPLEDCAGEAGKLEKEGFREIVLTGIEIASYGRDLPGKPDLAQAVKTVSKAAPSARLRLGSLHPTVVTEEFSRSLSELDRVCPHFHLSLQSGCDRTLRRMNRSYDTACFLQVCGRLRRFFPDCALTADLICGFPGETEKDFSDTLAFLEQCGFLFVHAFPYSVRPGTRAADLPGQLSSQEKDRRVQEAGKTIRSMRAKYLSSWIGRDASVLFENDHSGHSAQYCLVETEETAQRGRICTVHITGTDGERLFGNLESSCISAGK